MLRRIKLWHVLLALLCACFVAALSLGMFEQSPNAIRSQVLISRYVLGRWPESWSEVEGSVVRYPGWERATLVKFEKVEIHPINDTECDLVLTGRNAIGIRRQHEVKLVWTAAEETRLHDEAKKKEARRTSTQPP